MTDFGELLKAPQPTLDLAEAYQTGAIVYFALPVARFPETAPLVAKLIISDLSSVAGMVQDGQLERGFASIVIDEFAAFAMPLFVDLLNKGRSAGMAITISHQSMRGDLAAERGFVDQVADNTNIKICLRQSADAEYVAGLSGTYKTIKQTEQTLASLFGHERTGAEPHPPAAPGVCRRADQRPGDARPGETRPSRHLGIPGVLPAASGPCIVDRPRSPEARRSSRAEHSAAGCAGDADVRRSLVPLDSCVRRGRYSGPPPPPAEG